VAKDLLHQDHADEGHRPAHETSLGKDFFIVAVGVILISLAFLLFGSISGLGLKADFPRVSTPVIDDYGNPINVPEADIDSGTAYGFFRIGILSGLVAVIVFLATFILLRWSKKFNKQMMPHQDRAKDASQIGPLQ